MIDEIKKSVAKNTTVMMGTQAVTWVSSFILLLFLPRYLGSEDFGRLYLAISVSFIIAILVDFGGHYLIPKEVARHKEKAGELISSYLGLRVIIWVVLMIIFILFGVFVEYSPVILILIFFIGISKLWESLAKVLRSSFQGFEMMEYPSIGAIAEKVFVSAVAVTALLLGANAIVIALIMAVGTLIHLIINVKFLPKIVNEIPQFKIRPALDLIGTSIPYFLWSVFAVIYYRIDAIMLSLFSTEQVVGWYGGAYRFFDIVMFMPSIFTTVVFPILSRLWTDEKELFPRMIRTSIKFMFLSALPIAIIIFFFASPIVDLFYGLAEYGPSVMILQIFALGIPLVYVDFMLGTGMLATDRQKAWAYVGLGAVFVNIGLNLFLIPVAQTIYGNGAVGAAVATLITELFVMGWALYLLPREYVTDLPFAVFAKAVLAGFLIAIGIWGMNGLNVWWILQIVIALLAYVGLLLIAKALTDGEIEYLKSFVKIRQLKSYIIGRNPVK